MRLVKTIVPLGLVVAAAAALPASASAAPAASALREFEGTVVSVNRDNRTFRLHDTERGTVRIKVNRDTRYERIAGLRGLRAGQTNIEAIVRRSNGRWVALEVERSGGGGEHGGDDDDDRGRDDDRGGDDDSSGPGSGDDD
jgi:hypothetical protein